MAETLADYLASQEELLQEAAQALPHEFSKCTYSLGPIRQAVYLCLTCPEERGICSACSIACHTDHDQLELFPKRNFRCDCPTTSVTHACTLHKNIEPENTSNKYGRNFKAQFCRCGRAYNAKTERETMIQCIACEDWFHESCCNLRERPTSRETSVERHPEQTADIEEGNEGLDDTLSEGSSALPPALIPGSEYESFVCGSCASKNSLLMKWAGTPGVIMVVRDAPTQLWRRLEDDPLGANGQLVDIDGIDTDNQSSVNIKRPLSPSSNVMPEAKRIRVSLSAPLPPHASCLAPPANPTAQTIFGQLDASPESSLGAGDLFLSEGFRERWCRCASCLPFLEANPYLSEEEETYEPPEDPDSDFPLRSVILSDYHLGLSLEELGMRALERLPRDRAIDGIHAFNGLRDDLVNYLRPFAQEGKVVNETDVRTFFASLTEAAKKSRG